MKAPTTRQTRAARAEALFAVYYQAGPNRSLEALQHMTAKLGGHIALSTLKDYSADYGWQVRIAALDEQDAKDEAGAVKALEAMNQRQAALGRAAQDIAAAAFGFIAKQPEDIGPGDAIRLAKEGQHMERLAMGEATSRAEIQLTVYSELLIQIEALFIEVNKLENAGERDRRFRVGVDSLIDAHASGGEAELRAINAPSAIEPGVSPAPATP